ncbi:hypothetical protein B0H12DRAFT_1069080 [Mycena haematopus]|nr:hypothetical protein B0H12DRAFT_1069080 [Mycena haematopus]
MEKGKSQVKTAKQEERQDDCSVPQQYVRYQRNSTDGTWSEDDIRPKEMEADDVEQSSGYARRNVRTKFREMRRGMRADHMEENPRKGFVRTPNNYRGVKMPKMRAKLRRPERRRMSEV